MRKVIQRTFELCAYSGVTVGYEHSVEYIHRGCSEWWYIVCIERDMVAGFILKCEPVVFGQSWIYKRDSTQYHVLFDRMS